jgi:putative peptidoglycan lipid II flippase
MSEHAARDDLMAFRSDFSAALRSICLIIVFFSAAIIVAAYPIARFFTGSYEAMGNVLMAYAVGLVPFVCLFVIQRAFYSLADTRTPFLFTLAQVAVIVVGTLSCFAVPASLRAMAIAFVVSFACTVQTVIAGVLLRRRLVRLDGRRVFGSLVRFLASGVVAAAFGLAVLVALGGFSGGFAIAGPLSAVVAIACIGVVMLVVYVIMLRLLRTRELADAIGLVRARVGR